MCSIDPHPTSPHLTAVVELFTDVVDPLTGLDWTAADANQWPGSATVPTEGKLQAEGRCRHPMLGSAGILYSIQYNTVMHVYIQTMNLVSASVQSMTHYSNNY